MSENKNMNTKEKVTFLETQVRSLLESNLALAASVEQANNMVSQLNEKVNALIALSEADQPITFQNIQDQRANANIQAMKTQVKQLLDSGAIKPSESISEKSFIVISETELSTGKLVQPRMQVAIQSMPTEMVNDFLGKKLNDTIEREGFLVQIIELYDIVELQG